VESITRKIIFRVYAAMGLQRQNYFSSAACDLIQP